jgi:hypothetical protein
MAVRQALALVLTVALAQAQTPSNRRQFVTCPIVRDTKTLPCWLAKYKGEMYFLGMQGGVAQEFYPPQLGHEVLVEGTVTEGAPRVCGGIRLSQVKVSVLTELAPACNTMLPAEDGIDGIVVPRLTGVPPTWVRMSGDDKATIFFDFDNDFLSLHMTRAVQTVAERALKAPAMTVHVTGFRGATRLSAGGVITEKPGMAEVRARKVAGILVGLGVAQNRIAVEARAEPVAPDGISDPFARNVTVVLGE